MQGERGNVNDANVSEIPGSEGNTLICGTVSKVDIYIT